MIVVVPDEEDLSVCCNYYLRRNCLRMMREVPVRDTDPDPCINNNMIDQVINNKIDLFSTTATAQYPQIKDQTKQCLLLSFMTFEN